MLFSEVNNTPELLFIHRPKIILTRFLLLSFLSIWIYGFLRPVIISADNPISNFLLSRSYSTVCHQENVKCISLGSETMLVCARCAGIYTGALIAGLLSLIIFVPSIGIRVLILSAIPLAMDVFFTFTGVYAYSQLAAFATGLIFGSVVYLFLLKELENLFSNKSFMGNE